MKYYICDLTRAEKAALKTLKYNVYDLRLSDDGSEIATIEDYVLVNNCGNIVTSEPLQIEDYIDYYEFCSNNDQVDFIEDTKK